MSHVLHFLNDEGGATAIEYALLATLISIAGIAAMTSIGTNVSMKINDAATALS